MIGPVRLRSHVGEGLAAPSPGMLQRHYSPTTTLRIWRLDETLPFGRVGLLSWKKPFPHGFTVVVDLSPSGNLAEAASRLFSALRELDAAVST